MGIIVPWWCKGQSGLTLISVDATNSFVRLCVKPNLLVGAKWIPYRGMGLVTHIGSNVCG
jgi:hypothetical protein